MGVDAGKGFGNWPPTERHLAESLNELILRCDMPVILAVNKNLVDQVVENWQLQNPLTIKAKNISPEEAFTDIIHFTGLK